MCERVFSVGFGPGLDSMSPARSRHSASYAAGTHGWLPQKIGWTGLRRGGIGRYNLHSPPDCGTPTTCRLYPFGAGGHLHLCIVYVLFVAQGLSMVTPRYFGKGGGLYVYIVPFYF